MAIDVLAPVAGLPEGPAAEATVKLQLKIAAARDDAELQLAINAANLFAARRTILGSRAVAQGKEQGDGWEWPADLVTGATLLASRLYSRRNSPDGVNEVGDVGAVYVSRNDPDVAMMLGLGSHTPPMVG